MYFYTFLYFFENKCLSWKSKHWWFWLFKHKLSEWWYGIFLLWLALGFAPTLYWLRPMNKIYRIWIDKLCFERLVANITWTSKCKCDKHMHAAPYLTNTLRRVFQVLVHRVIFYKMKVNQTDKKGRHANLVIQNETIIHQ